MAKESKVCLINLGCKVNKYELDCMGTILKNNGYKIITEHKKADYYIVNTCAVTNESEKKSRQYIAKLNALNPNAKIIVCGCASEHDVNQFKDKPNVISVIGNFGKQNVLELMKGGIYKKEKQTLEYEPLCNPLKTKTRAYLKVQDGCNNFCSYCLIPYIRGRSRSRNLLECVNEAYKLAKTSHEIVVTGIDLSSYSINNKPALGDLMVALSDVNKYNCRLRLGSLEVMVITEEFLKKLKSLPNFAPQFHLSMQSGCNEILKQMNRHYTVKEFLNKVKLIRKYFKNANITTDVIVGFAEETDKQFKTTCKTCKKAKFGAIHIFPYSKRDGTVAAKFNNVSNAVKKERVKKLEEIANKLKAKYIKHTIKNLKQDYVVVEEKNDEYYEGFTSNYVKTYIKTDKNILGTNTLIKFIKPFKDGILGEIYE